MNAGLSDARLAQVSPELRIAILAARERVEAAITEASRQAMLALKAHKARETRKARGGSLKPEGWR